MSGRRIDGMEVHERGTADCLFDDGNGREVDEGIVRGAGLLEEGVGGFAHGVVSPEARRTRPLHAVRARPVLGGVQ